MAVNLQTYLQLNHPQQFQADALQEAQALPPSVQAETLTMLRSQGVHAGGNGPTMVIGNAGARVQHALGSTNLLHHIVDKAGAPISAKVTNMLAKVTPQLTAAETQNLRQRLAGLTPAQTKTLEAQLHIPEGKAKTSAERVQIRAAILNAFAKNASLEVTGELRRALLDASWLARDEAFAALARPGASVRGVVDRLTHKDYPAAIDAAILESFDNVHSTKQNMAAVAKAAAKVDAYVDANLDKLGLRNASDREVAIAKKELLAVSVYTHDEGFRKVNDLLRGTSNLGPKERQAVEVYARAITNGLARLPEYQGLSFRNAFTIGGNHPAANQPAHQWAAAHYVQGATVTEAAVTSSSPEKGFTGKEIRFTIHSRHGKETGPISLTPKDGFEATFRPNTQFEVLASQSHQVPPVPGTPPVPVQFVVMKEADHVPDPGTVL